MVGGEGVAGTSFEFFPGGQTVDCHPRGGNLKKTKLCVQTHKSHYIFQIQGGGGQMPTPPQMTSLGGRMGSDSGGGVSYSLHFRVSHRRFRRVIIDERDQ